MKKIKIVHAETTALQGKLSIGRQPLTELICIFVLVCSLPKEICPAILVLHYHSKGPGYSRIIQMDVRIWGDQVSSRRVYRRKMNCKCKGPNSANQPDHINNTDQLSLSIEAKSFL
uniref:Uncharacterized protein n=1 Tax=Manihot esculenta TaxID=3983 RepID=A0A2C9U8J2_MANES